MSPHDDGVAITELRSQPRWKCGEIYTWNNAELYAVECVLCDDKILCTLLDFAEHMQVWHRSWECASDNDEDAADAKSGEAKAAGQTIRPLKAVPPVDQEMEISSSMELRMDAANVKQQVKKSTRNNDRIGTEDMMVDNEEMLEKMAVDDEAAAVAQNNGGVQRAAVESNDKEKIWRMIVAEATGDEKKDPLSSLAPQPPPPPSPNKMQMQSQIAAGQEQLTPFEEVLIGNHVVKANDLKDEDSKHKDTITPHHMHADSEKLLTIQSCEQMRHTEESTKLSKKLHPEHMLLFIELYKAHPRLWNASHPEFSETELGRESWEEITRKLNAACESNFKINDLKIRISAICQRYRAEKQRLKNEQPLNNNDSEETSECTRHLDSLRFLDHQPDAAQIRRNILHNQNLKIIEIYKRFPLLWHTASKHKQSPVDRTEALDKISESLKSCGIHLSSTSVQRRLRALQKCYSKEKCKYLHSVRENRTFRTNFKHYEQMQFLQKHVAPYECDMCGEIFEKVHEHTEHMMAIHGENEEQKQQEDLKRQEEMCKDEEESEKENAPNLLDANENILVEKAQKVQEEGKNMDSENDSNKENSDGTLSANLLNEPPDQVLMEQEKMDGLEVDKFLATLLEREPFMEIAANIFNEKDPIHSVENASTKIISNDSADNVVLKQTVDSFEFPLEFSNAMDEIFNRNSSNTLSGSLNAPDTPCNAFEVAAYEDAGAPSPLNLPHKSTASTEHILTALQSPLDSPKHNLTTQKISNSAPESLNSPRLHLNPEIFLNSAQESLKPQLHKFIAENTLNSAEEPSQPQQSSNSPHQGVNSPQQASDLNSTQNNYTKQNTQHILNSTKTSSPSQHLNTHVVSNLKEEITTPPQSVLNTQIVSHAEEKNTIRISKQTSEKVSSSTQQNLNSGQIILNIQDIFNNTQHNSAHNILTTQCILSDLQDLKIPQQISKKHPILTEHLLKSTPIILSTENSFTSTEDIISTKYTLNPLNILNISEHDLNSKQLVLDCDHILAATQQSTNPAQQISNTQNVFIQKSSGQQNSNIRHNLRSTSKNSTQQQILNNAPVVTQQNSNSALQVPNTQHILKATRQNSSLTREISYLEQQTLNNQHLLSAPQQISDSAQGISMQPIFDTTRNDSKPSQQLLNPQYVLSNKSSNSAHHILDSHYIIETTQHNSNSASHISNGGHRNNEQNSVSAQETINTKTILITTTEDSNSGQPIFSHQSSFKSNQNNSNLAQENPNIKTILITTAEDSNSEYQILDSGHTLKSNDQNSNSAREKLNAQTFLITTLDESNSAATQITNAQNAFQTNQTSKSSAQQNLSTPSLLITTPDKSNSAYQLLKNQRIPHPASQTQKQTVNTEDVFMQNNSNCTPQIFDTQHILRRSQHNANSTILNVQDTLTTTTLDSNVPPEVLNSSIYTTNSITNDLSIPQFTISYSEDTVNQGDINVQHIYLDPRHTTLKDLISVAQSATCSQHISLDSINISRNEENMYQIVLNTQPSNEQNPMITLDKTMVMPQSAVNIIQTISAPQISMNISQNVVNISQEAVNISKNYFSDANANASMQTTSFPKNNANATQYLTEDEEMPEQILSGSCQVISSTKYSKNNTQLGKTSSVELSNSAQNPIRGTEGTKISTAPQMQSAVVLNGNHGDFLKQEYGLSNTATEYSTATEPSELITSDKDKDIERALKNMTFKIKKTFALDRKQIVEDACDSNYQDSVIQCEVMITDKNNSDSSDFIPLLASSTSTRLSEEQTHSLIAIYKDQQALWNPFHKDYNSRNAKHIAWKTITVTFNRLFKLRLKWHSVYKKLTDFVKYYRRESERVTKENITSKWFYFNDFKFLDEYLDITSDSQKMIREKELNLKIIEIYKTYPQLWNTHLQEYKRRSQRAHHIAAMHKSLQEEANVHISIERLKRKLLDFRCAYRQEKEKRIESTRNNEAFESFYEYYNELAFLEPHISPFSCKVCGETFTKLTEIMRHYRATKHQKISKKRIHLRGIPNPENDVKNVCHICGAKFTMRNNLIYHLNRHMGKRTHKCSMCPKSFYNSTALRVHERSHTKELPYVCEQCGQAFVNNSKLNQHRKRHTGKRDFLCNECGKGYFTAFERDKHVRGHLKIRDQICPICGKAFIFGSSIYTHMELHSEVKKYVCKICDKRFSQNSGLYRHKKWHRAQIEKAQQKSS